MCQKPDLFTYVSSGQFAADIERLYPQGPFSPASNISSEDLARLAKVLSPAVRRELFALADLGRAGKLPQLGRENQPVGLPTMFIVGYSIADDLGDDLEDAFDGGGTPFELAKTAIGLACNGGGITHFLLADGHVASLSMEAYNTWQWPRFASLGEYCWVVFHGRAAAAGRFPVEQLKATVATLDCTLAAHSVDVPESVLPPLPPRPDDVPDWLK